MRKIPALTLFAVIAATFAAPAYAQPTRVWLSGTGVDSGTCPRQSPCHTLTYAHGQVAAQPLEVAGAGHATRHDAESFLIPNP